jgi:hypothetical protein
MSKKSEEDTPNPAVSHNRGSLRLDGGAVVYFGIGPSKFTGSVGRRGIYISDNIRVQSNRG